MKNQITLSREQVEKKKQVSLDKFRRHQRIVRGEDKPEHTIEQHTEFMNVAWGEVLTWGAILHWMD